MYRRSQAGHHLGGRVVRCHARGRSIGHGRARGYAYVANKEEVVKLDRIYYSNDAPAAVLTRQPLTNCASGLTDLAVDVRGNVYVSCVGGSVARALVESDNE